MAACSAHLVLAKQSDALGRHTVRPFRRAPSARSRHLGGDACPHHTRACEECSCRRRGTPIQLTLELVLSPHVGSGKSVALRALEDAGTTRRPPSARTAVVIRGLNAASARLVQCDGVRSAVAAWASAAARTQRRRLVRRLFLMHPRTPWAAVFGNAAAPSAIEQPARGAGQRSGARPAACPGGCDRTRA